MGHILRIGFRHLEALQFQTVYCVSAVNWSRPSFSFEDWLVEQAPELIPAFKNLSIENGPPVQHEREHYLNYAGLLKSVIFSFEYNSNDPEILAHFQEDIKSTSASDHASEDDAGANLGGSWDVEPFSFRAGIILSLGALDGFERGVIRILTRLQFLNKDCRLSVQPFCPKLSDFLSTNPIWEDFERRRKTFTPRGRMQILRDIGVQRSNSDWQERLDLARRDRNKIVHGYEAFPVSFSQYLRVHYDVFSAMRDMGRQVLKTQNVEL